MASSPNTGRNVILGLVLMLLIALFVWMFSGVSWMEHYRKDSRDPYGLRLLVESLGGEGRMTVVSEKGLAARLDSTRKNGLYVYVGSFNYMDSADAEALVRFAQRGNRVFLAAEGTTHHFQSLLFAEQRDSSFTELNWDSAWWEELADADPEDWDWAEEDWDWEEEELATEANSLDSEMPDMRIDTEKGVIWRYQTRVKLYQSRTDSVARLAWPDRNGLTSEAKLRMRYDNMEYDYGWTFFQPDIATRTGVEAVCIGQFNGKYCNLLRLRTGEGEIVMCSTPVAFTNYFLRSESVADIAEPLFPPAETIIWDEYNRQWHFDPSDFNYDDRYTEREGPLEFILRNRHLSWAWYILLVGTVLYFVAGARRKQRIIPIKDPNLNTSIEFAETMSRLYWKEGDHRKIGLLKWQLFLIFVRDRYGMRLSETDIAHNRKQVPLLTTKSGLDRAKLEEILESAEVLIGTPQSTNETLVRLHASIEHFYAKCK